MREKNLESTLSFEETTSLSSYDDLLSYACDAYACSSLSDAFSWDYPFGISLLIYVEFEKEKTRAFRSEGTGRKTGNNLLSHGSEAALPSATEGLTSVFGMETCVSPRLWSPDRYPADRQNADGLVVTAAVRDYGKISLTSGNASAVRKNGDYDEWNVSDH